MRRLLDSAPLTSVILENGIRPAFVDGKQTYLVPNTVHKTIFGQPPFYELVREVLSPYISADGAGIIFTAAIHGFRDTKKSAAPIMLYSTYGSRLPKFFQNNAKYKEAIHAIRRTLGADQITPTVEMSYLETYRGALTFRGVVKPFSNIPSLPQYIYTLGHSSSQKKPQQSELTLSYLVNGKPFNNANEIERPLNDEYRVIMGSLPANIPHVFNDQFYEQT